MLKLNIICFLIISSFILTINYVYSQSDIVNRTVDKTILRTDSVGNILGGDAEDWNFDKSYYHYFQKYKDFFYRPFIESEPHPAEMPTPIFSKVVIDKAKIMWNTEREKDFREFVIERKSMLESEWDKGWFRFSTRILQV